MPSNSSRHPALFILTLNIPALKELRELKSSGLEKGKRTGKGKGQILELCHENLPKLQERKRIRRGKGQRKRQSFKTW
jgi:hypothetical protein